MPAKHDDPAAPVIYRTFGPAPYPNPSNPQLPPTIFPKQVTLRDRVTIATLIPFPSSSDVPHSLLTYLCNQMNKEIEKGDTYPMVDLIPLESFGSYWFANFGAVMLLGDINSTQEVQSMDRAGADWTKLCLGGFHIKPNYPGRSSHVCNGTFLVTDAARNKGVGRLMGEGYLEWAPLLGYSYSVFNLVYETNVASCRIWDALGFKRIGKVPGSGSLRSYPGQLVDAIIYGRDLGPEGEDFVSEERFDKIRYYLKHSKYPTGADRAEKSRLRSAATHYKLVGGQDGEPEKLMLKDKEVVSDPQQQYEIARQIHLQQHGGINKTTATIALKYHWVRIKETVSMVIKNCPQCKETPKAPPQHNTENGMKREKAANQNQSPNPTPNPNSNPSPTPNPREAPVEMPPCDFTNPSDQLIHSLPYDGKQDPFASTHPPVMHDSVDVMNDYTDIPLDPQIMDDIQQHLPRFQSNDGVEDPYGQNTLHDPHSLQHTDFDHPQLQHHDHTNDYQVDDDGEMIASQAAAALRQQAMGLVDASHLENDTQLHQDLLAAAGFVSRDGTSHFDH